MIMNKKHFDLNSIYLFIICSLSCILIIVANAFAIYFNHNDTLVMVLFIVFELIALSMFVAIMIWLIFYLKCFSFYFYNDNQLEYHFFNNIITIKYTEIVSVDYNERAFFRVRGIDFSYVNIISKNKTIVLRTDLYLKEVRALLMANNCNFNEDDYISGLIKNND